MNSNRHLKLSWLCSVILSFPEIFAYLYISYGKKKSIIEVLYSNEEIILNIIFLGMIIIQYGFFMHFSWIILTKRFRLTVKIEVFLIVSLTTCYLISISLAKNPESGSFLLILLFFSLNEIQLFSFIIRSNLLKIPDPPLVCFNSAFIYEHKLFYQHIHGFAKGLPDTNLLDLLELGIYINMYKAEKRKLF